MVARVKAKVKPALLVWARRTAGYEQPEVAAKLNVDPEKIAGWEVGEEQPSIAQVRKLAELYKRPLAVLFLPEPPATFRPMHDFRRLPEIGPRRFSPGLTLEIRNAHQRRALALEMLADADERPARFELKANIADKPDSVAEIVRGALGVTYELQAKWRDPRVGFHAWRSRMEQLGVLVFQSARFAADEASGFAYAAEELPIVVVNGKDAFARRSFSLLHEFAHLLLHESGVSDADVDAPRPAEDARVEMWCNSVAAAALVPRQQFLAEPLILERGPGLHEWEDQLIETLSKTYSVSREVIVRRLATLGRATEAFYRRKRAQFTAEFNELRQRQRAQARDADIRRNMPRETVAEYGRPFVRMVLENYHQERITLSDVSGYLGVKVRHLPKVEQLAMG
jgi:Zn-dependent peptidase ImmA (M78 family)